MNRLFALVCQLEVHTDAGRGVGGQRNPLWETRDWVSRLTTATNCVRPVALGRHSKNSVLVFRTNSFTELSLNAYVLLCGHIEQRVFVNIAGLRLGCRSRQVRPRNVVLECFTHLRHLDNSKPWVFSEAGN